MKDKTKEKLKEGCGEAVAEIVLSLIFCAIGAGVLALLGVSLSVEWLDEDLVMLIGILAIAIPAAIIFAVVHTVRKRKRNSIKKIEIHIKNEPKENNLDNTEKKGQDDV